MSAPRGLGPTLLGESWFAFALRLGYLALAVASLVPGQYRPSSVILPDTVEHALAYLLVGGLSVLATRITDVARAAWIASAIAAYAGVLELCQALLPGRVASVEDFIASAIGGVIGISLATLSRRSTAPRRHCPKLWRDGPALHPTSRGTSLGSGKSGSMSRLAPPRGRPQSCGIFQRFNDAMAGLPGVFVPGSIQARRDGRCSADALTWTTV